MPQEELAKNGLTLLVKSWWETSRIFRAYTRGYQTSHQSKIDFEAISNNPPWVGLSNKQFSFNATLNRKWDMISNMYILSKNHEFKGGGPKSIN